MTHAKPSKSARKREHQALQELGKQLITLKNAELDSMRLDDNLLTAVRNAASMESHGALRRQKQLIGKLMQHADTESIRAALLKLGASERQSKRLFAAAERWRNRLVNGGAAALDAFEIEMALQDKQLRQLLDELAATVSERTGKSLRRQVFRRVHDILVAQTQDG